MNPALPRVKPQNKSWKWRKRRSAKLIEAEQKAVAKRESAELNLPKRIYGVSKDCSSSAARTDPTSPTRKKNSPSSRRLRIDAGRMGESANR